MVFRARAPLRISFAGGGTDVPPFPVSEGGLVLNATINRYAYGTLRPRDDDRVHIESLDVGQTAQYSVGDDPIFDGKLDLAKAAVRRVADANGHGFELFLQSSVPPGSGLGLSSTVIVAIIGLLKEFRSLDLTEYELAELAYRIERRDLGIRGGVQDQYAATFGGFNFLELEGDSVVVNPLRVSPEVVLELEHNLLLCYTGRRRESQNIIADQTARFEQRERDTLEGLRAQKRLAVEMKNALLRKQLDTFGELLDEAWQAKRRMSPQISTDRIEELYHEARRAGAIGGKVTGAGGGGYLLVYCGEGSKHRVADALKRAGGAVLDFAFTDDGLRTWRVNGHPI
jgi:D-glycero-alpha-D-manno-heptose-7-phosphate kinase